MEGLLRIKRDIAPISSEAVFSIYGYPITNTTLMLVLIVGLVIVAAFVLNRNLRQIPGKFQNVIEFFYEGILKLVTQITGNRERSEKVFPLIGTLFVFIFVSNFIGLIPGLGSLSYDGVGMFRTPTSDFNTTFSIALAMVLLLQVISIKEWGIFAYLGKFFQFHLVIRGFRKSFGEGFNAIVNFFIGLLDIVGEVAKVVSLSLRLFGNMYAGDVLATIIIGGIAYGIPALWMSMNMLAAVVQTLVFSFLVTAYYTLAIKPESAAAKDENPVINNN